jgi:hypothetical protein
MIVAAKASFLYVQHSARREAGVGTRNIPPVIL